VPGKGTFIIHKNYFLAFMLKDDSGNVRPLVWPQ